MFKSLFLAALFLCASPALAQGNWSIADINKHIDQTNFILGSPGDCSATLISTTERLLLTNHHCIAQYIGYRSRDVVADDGTLSQVKTEYIKDVPASQKVYDGHQIVSQMNYQTIVLAYDKDTDLALLQFRAATIPNGIASEIYTGPAIMRGEVVYVVGNPFGVLDAALTKGIISSTSRRLKIGNDEHNYYQFDAGIVGGNSGGSLYTESGKLIGVPAAGAPGTSVGLAIPYPDIQEFLREACFASVFDMTAESHADCIAVDEEE